MYSYIEVYIVIRSYIGGTMSKIAYIVRHINFENAGILESVLIDRGFELTYIEAPLANFEHYDATEADLIIVCGAPIGAYDEELYPFLTDEIKFITDRINSQKPLLGVLDLYILLLPSYYPQFYPSRIEAIVEAEAISIAPMIILEHSGIVCPPKITL